MTELSFVKDLAAIGPTAGTILVAVILARKLDNLADRLMTVMETVINKNTTALTEVRDALTTCKKHGQ